MLNVAPNQQSFTKKYVDGAGTVQLSQNPYEGNQSCLGDCEGDPNAKPCDPVITQVSSLKRALIFSVVNRRF